MEWFALLWLIVLLGDNLLPFLLAAFYPDYRHTQMALSVLGCRLSPVKRIYNGWCILSGVVFCAAGYGVSLAFSAGLGTAAGILMVLYGLGCEIISGLFPLASQARDNSLSTIIHGIGSALGFTCLVLVPFFLGLAALPAHPLFGLFSFVSFTGALVCFSFFIMGEKERFSATVLRLGGLWQRLTLLACYLPFVWLTLSSLLGNTPE